MKTAALLIAAFCAEFANHGAHPGAPICKETDAEARLLCHGFDGRKLCSEAINDCRKYASLKRCTEGKFRFDKNSPEWETKQLIGQIVSTIGFAPEDVKAKFKKEDWYRWRPKGVRK